MSNDKNSVLIEYRGGYAITYDRSAERFEVHQKHFTTLGRARAWATSASISGGASLSVPVVIRKRAANKPETFTKATLVSVGRYSRAVVYPDGTQEAMRWYRDMYLDDGRSAQTLTRLVKAAHEAARALRDFEKKMQVPERLEDLVALSRPVKTKKVSK